MIASLGQVQLAGNVDLVVFFVVGVLAGAHCLGMCGPLIGIYADRIPDGGREDVLTLFEVRQHALFNGGRVVGYAAVGALFGLLGATVFATAERLIAVGVGVRAAAGLLVGGFVVVSGIGYLRRGAGRSGLESLPVVMDVFQRINGILTAHVDRLARSSGIVILGTVHAALPCPIIYPAYLYAFAIGDPLRGGLALAVLGLGTFPSLFAYGTMLGTLNPSHRGTLHRVLGIAFVALGYILLSHSLHLLGVAVPPVDLPYYQPLATP